MNILFIGDVFGRPGRDALCGVAARLSRRPRPGLRDGQRREHRQRRRHHLQDRPAPAGGRRGRASPPATTCGARERCIPFLATDERIVRPANYPSRRAGPGPHGARRRADGHEVAVINLAGQLYMSTGMSPFRIVDRLVDEASATGRDRRGRPARRGDQREGRHGPLPGRPRHGGAGHAHARADRRRARAAGRHRLPHGRRHDGPARIRHRRAHATSSCGASSPSCRSSSRSRKGRCASTRPSSKRTLGARRTSARSTSSADVLHLPLTICKYGPSC